MANPLLIQAGATAAGAVVNRLFNNEPDVPELQDETRSRMSFQQRFLEQAQQRRAERMAEEMSARGVQGTGAIGPTAGMAEQHASESARLSAARADAEAQAANQEARIRFERDTARHEARAQGIGQMVGAVGQYAVNRDMLDRLDDNPLAPLINKPDVEPFRMSTRMPMAQIRQ